MKVLMKIVTLHSVQDIGDFSSMFTDKFLPNWSRTRKSSAFEF